MDQIAAPSVGFAPWTARRRWWFRTGLALVLLQVVVSVLDLSPGTRAVANAMHDAARAGAAAISTSAVAALEQFAERSNGHAEGLSLLRDALLAIVIAAVWSALDRRTQHERGARRLRMILRYLVGTIMLIYGGLKVVPVQFQQPPGEQLLMRLGDHSPMSLLWACIGISPVYTVFCGLGEFLGGTLLFWRRTTTLGALLIAAVMTNVVMLNFCYDIPVKRGSALLWLAAIVLASRDARALAAVLWHRQPATPEPEAPFGGGLLAHRVRAVVKPIWIAAAVFGPTVTALVVRSPRSASPLLGVHVVERDATAPTNLPPAEAWRLLWIGDHGQAVLQTEDLHSSRWRVAIDETAGTLTLSSGSQTRRFQWTRGGQRLRLQPLEGAAQPMELRSQSAAEAFRLLR